MKIALMPGDLAERGAKSGSSWSGLSSMMKTKMPIGTSATTTDENFPWAVSTVTSRRTSMRARMFVGHLVEHLRGVAARLALHEREHGDLVDVACSASAWP